MQLNLFIFLLIGIFLVCNNKVHAADFYVDPVNGSMDNDGSQASPWSTMQEVWDSCKIHTRSYQTPWSTTIPETILDKCPEGIVQSGDTIYLMSGYQGDLNISGALNSDYITVKAYPGQTPTFSHILTLGAAYWIFDGVKVSPSYAPTFSVYANGIIEISKHANIGPCNHITIKNSEVFSVSDSFYWTTLEEWWLNTSRAIVSWGEYTVVDNVTIRNASGAVALGLAHHSTVRNCNINYLSGDMLGIYGTNDLLIENNSLTNMIPAGESHDLHPDMIQFSAVGVATPEVGVTVRGNYVNSLQDYGIHPLVGGSCQGVSGFDGMFEDFVMENNVVVVNSPHGMSLYGATNCRIVNNTVVWAVDGMDYDYSTIRIYDHKDGTLSMGNIMRNNISSQLSVSAGDGVTVDHNLTDVVLNDNFVDSSAWDFHLKSISPAIDAGSVNLSPSIDKDSNTRDAFPDIGAYEYVSTQDLNSPVAPHGLAVQ